MSELIDALNADPDLSVIVRPSLDFHFSALWHGEPVHETFWSLAIRLDEGREGHVLASLAAAAACLRDGLSPGDLDFLIEACQGHGPISAFRDDARRLLMLIAGVMPTPDIPSARRRAAVPVIATAAAQLATAAEASEDIDLARLVAVVLHRLRTAVRADPVPVATTDRDSAAAAVMRLALTDPPAAGRADLASRSAGLVADAIINDSVSYAGLAEQIGDAATMNAWGMRPVQELLWQLPAIGPAAPDHARRLVLSVWDFEVTDDSPEFIGSSQILSFSTTKAREAEQARWEIGNQFPAWLAAALSGAVNAFLEIIRRSAPPWPSRVKIADGHPSVRRSMPLMSGKGYDTLTEITGSLASHLKSTAARSAAGQGASGVLPQILDQLADGLVHDEVWNTLLAAGAANPSDLGAAFLPLLEQGQLLDHPATHAAAAGLVRAISPILDNQSHARLERRILAVRNCTDPADHEAAQDMQDRLIGCLAPEQLQEDKTRQRLAELNAAGGPPETPPSAPSGWPFRPLDPSIPLSTDPASEEDNQLLTAIEAVSNALQSRRNSGQNQDGGFADLRSAFTVLAAELRRRYPSPPQGQAGQANYHSARTFLCAAADALTADPLTAPGTDLGNQILDIFLQALPPKADPETEPR